MELDIKNLEQQDAKALVKSLELVSARLLDCITKSSQTACFATPETQYLYNQWVELISENLIEASKEGKINCAQLSLEMGISAEAVTSLALSLARQGKLRIKSLEVETSEGKNKEICGCMNND